MRQDFHDRRSELFWQRIHASQEFAGHGWEVFGTLSYDVKWGGYDSWLIGIGIAKAFGRKMEEK